VLLIFKIEKVACVV